MGATLTTITPALREHYTGKTLIDIFYTYNKDVNPLMAATEAVADTGEGFGRKLITQFCYGTGSTVGATFSSVLSKAQGSTEGSAGLYGRWETSPQTIDAVARWDRTAMDAVLSRGAGETFRVMTKEMDLKIAAVRRLMAIHAWGDGTGALGTIVTLSASPAYITVDPSEANRFERGMDLVSATSTTAALKNAGASIRVTGVNPENGKISLSSSPLASTAWAIGDVVGSVHDRVAAGLSSYADHIVPHGIQSWIVGPEVTDSAAFDGNTRDDNWQLAGLTCDCSSLEPEAAFRKALTMLWNTTGTKADALFCNPDDYDAFIINKDKAKTVSISLGKYDLGFEGFNVHSLAGTVPVLPDAFCPKGQFVAGPWKDSEVAPRLVYCGDLVQIDNKDGMDFQRSATGTAYEMRLYFRGNLVLPAPGKFVRGYSLSV